MQEIRKNWIGASEVSVLLNLNPFTTPLKLWSLKTGLIEPDEQTDYQEWGHRLEPVVAKKFAEAHDVKLMAYKRRFIHPVMSYFSCELDTIITGTEELCEIKSVNAFQWKAWEKPDELPGYVIAQVTAQMGLSNRKKAWVACLCGGSKYIEKEVPFDAELYKTIEERVKDFWENYVLKNIPPVAVSDDNSLIVDIYPNSNDAIQSCEEMENDIARRQELAMHISELEGQKDEIEARLKMIIADNAGIKTSSYLVTWKNQNRTALDTEKIKADGLYEKYSKTSSSRVLRVGKNSKG